MAFHFHTNIFAHFPQLHFCVAFSMSHIFHPCSTVLRFTVRHFQRPLTLHNKPPCVACVRYLTCVQPTYIRRTRYRRCEKTPTIQRRQTVVDDDDGVEQPSFAGERDQLATEALVGENERALGAQVLNDVEQGASLGDHQVGGDDGAAAVDAEVTVDQRTAACALHVVEKRDRFREMTLYVVVLAVLRVDIQHTDDDRQ